MCFNNLVSGYHVTRQVALSDQRPPYPASSLLRKVTISLKLHPPGHPYLGSRVFPLFFGQNHLAFLVCVRPLSKLSTFVFVRTGCSPYPTFSLFFLFRPIQRSLLLYFASSTLSDLPSSAIFFSAFFAKASSSLLVYLALLSHPTVDMTWGHGSNEIRLRSGSAQGGPVHPSLITGAPVTKLQAEKKIGNQLS